MNFQLNLVPFLSVTFFSTLFLDLELALYLKKTATPKIMVRVPDPALEKRKFTTNPALAECPQLKIVRIDGSLFFGAVSHMYGNNWRKYAHLHHNKNICCCWRRELILSICPVQSY